MVYDKPIIGVADYTIYKRFHLFHISTKKQLIKKQKFDQIQPNGKQINQGFNNDHQHWF